MNGFRKTAHWFLLTLSLSTAEISGASQEPASYFRANQGIGDPDGHSIPEVLDDDHLKWRKAIPSGHSTPLVLGNRLYMTGFDPATESLFTFCLDQRTGTEIWRRRAPTERIEAYHRVGNPAAATVATDGTRLFSFFGSYGLLAYDVSGQCLWTRPMGPFQDEFGAGSSPVLIDGKLVINQDHDADSFLEAFDPVTGEPLWKTPRPAAVRSYSTPIPYWSRNTPQILVAGALELAAYDPNSGEKLWWINGLARIVVPMPITAGENIIMASWAPGGDSGGRISMEPYSEALERWDLNQDELIAKEELEPGAVLTRFFRIDLNQDGHLNRLEWERHAAVFQKAKNSVMSFRPQGRGAQSHANVDWEYDRGIPYVASPLISSGILYMVKDGGIVTKLAAATGKPISQERVPGRGTYYASPLAIDGKVFFANEQGVVSVVRDALEWEVVSHRDFDERIYATPVAKAGRFFVRTEAALYQFSH